MIYTLDKNKLSKSILDFFKNNHIVDPKCFFIDSSLDNNIIKSVTRVDYLLIDLNKCNNFKIILDTIQFLLKEKTIIDVKGLFNNISSKDTSNFIIFERWKSELFNKRLIEMPNQFWDNQMYVVLEKEYYQGWSD